MEIVKAGLGLVGLLAMVGLVATPMVRSLLCRPCVGGAYEGKTFCVDCIQMDGLKPDTWLTSREAHGLECASCEGKIARISA
jgi:hypothetical protein